MSFSFLIKRDSPTNLTFFTQVCTNVLYSIISPLCTILQLDSAVWLNAWMFLAVPRIRERREKVVMLKVTRGIVMVVIWEVRLLNVCRHMTTCRGPLSVKELEGNVCPVQGVESMHVRLDALSVVR
jgi:hypothetical protein